MRRCSALLAGLAGLLASRAAHADDRSGDPRDVFGLGRAPVERPPSCDDGRAFSCATATDPLDDASPYALRTWLPASYLLELPVGDARHESIAHYAVGANRDDAGPSFGGATGLENRWTIDGAPADSLRTGNVDTRIPLAFLAGVFVSAGGFAARDRASTGGTIDAELRRGTDRHAVETRAWVGYSPFDGRTRPIPIQSYQLRRLAIGGGPDWSLAIVGTGPLPGVLGGRSWYAAGIAPAFAVTEFRWRAGTVIDADGDGDPDGLPGVIQTEPIATTTATTLDYLVPAMARVGWDRGPHRIELTLIGHAGRDTSFFANATQQAGGIDRSTWIGDGIVTWRGKWRATRARAQLAWHRSVRAETARDPAARDIPQLLSAYVPANLPDDPVIAAACADTAPDDRYPNIENCPIPNGFFQSGGAGLLVDSVGDRPSATIDVAHRRDRHVVRIGGTFEDSRLVNTSAFTGGELIRSVFEGHRDHQRFHGGSCPDDPAMACSYTARSTLSYRSRYTAAYIEDTFEPGSRIRVDGGLRWELMWVGPQLHFSNELAPRLGLAWDVFGAGRSRLWTSMGRSFIMLPPGIGPTVIARNRTVRDVESPFGVSRSSDSGSAYRVAPGIEPAAQDEVTLGFEAGVARTARANLWIQGRTLRRGYDNVLANEDTLEAAFDNPGRDGRTPATRHSLVVAAELSTDPRASTVVRASYLYGWTVGSWTGPFDPRQGAQLYAGTDWDFDAHNLYGRLPSDPGHRVAIEGVRRGRAGAVELAVSTRLTAASGRPRSVLGDSDLGIVQLLPRGSAGRGPMVTQANVRLAARWRGVDATLDVFNVFDREAATNVGEIYSGSVVRPIVGGDEQDLVFLKGDLGSAAVRRVAYRLPTAFQQPVSVILGVHKMF